MLCITALSQENHATATGMWLW